MGDIDPRRRGRKNEVRVCPSPRFLGDAEHLIAEHAARGLTIDHQTCEPDWDGYDMDYDIALYGLLASDGLAG